MSVKSADRTDQTERVTDRIGVVVGTEIDVLATVKVFQPVK
jgi:hypothetical protein